MSFTELHNDSTANPTTASFTTTTTTERTTTAFTTTAASWISSSYNSSSFENSTLSGPNSKEGSHGESQEHIAIICGVILGVLGLAIAVVALYIVTRKMKEKRTAQRHAALQMKESGSKPYETVDKDFDSVHDYREYEQPISSLSTLHQMNDVEHDAGSHSSRAYANTNMSSKPSHNSKHSSEPSEEYEQITIPSIHRSKDYVEMHVKQQGSNPNSAIVNQKSESSKDSNPPKHSHLINESSYVNMNEMLANGSNPEHRVSGKEEGTYANTSQTVANGQNGHSLTTKTKLPKINKKAEKYDISNETSADQLDITYKF